MMAEGLLGFTGHTGVAVSLRRSRTAFILLDFLDHGHEDEVED